MPLVRYLASVVPGDRGVPLVSQCLCVSHLSFARSAQEESHGK
jgi:hypothetical protein